MPASSVFRNFGGILASGTQFLNIGMDLIRYLVLYIIDSEEIERCRFLLGAGCFYICVLCRVISGRYGIFQPDRDIHAVQLVLSQQEHSNHREESAIGMTGFSLVDFQMKETYFLSGPAVGYGIRDYFVRFFTDKTLDEANNITMNGTVEVLIFHTEK